MFAKSLEKIAQQVPANSLIVAKKIRTTWDLDDNMDTDKGTVYAIIKTTDGNYIGVAVTKSFELFEANGDIRNLDVEFLDSNVSAYKAVLNPTIYSLDLLANTLAGIYEKYEAAGKPSSGLDLSQIQTEQRKLQQQMVKDQIKALKKKFRAERKADFFNAMRPVIAEEAQKIFDTGVESREETIAVITEIVNTVADEIVKKNYKLVEDYYDQAYLQLVKLEESIGEKILKSADKNVARILASTQQQMVLMANETVRIGEEFQKKISRLENIHALQVRALNTEKNFQLLQMQKKLQKAKAKPKAKPKAKAVKKPVKKAVKKKAKTPLAPY